MTIQRKKKIVIGIIIIAIGLIMLASCFLEKAEYVPYQTFYQAVQEEKVKQVVLEDNRICFLQKGSSKKYYTDHSKLPELKERLLLKGIDVQEASAEDTVNLIANLLFYMFFFIAVGLGVYKLTEITRTTFKVVKHTNVRFSDIAGMKDVKEEMMYIVSLLKNPSETARPIKGIILEGPPGNGKTLFAKALASEANVNFIATKGADFQSAMMSMGAQKIKLLFKKAARHKPCIIFIDEFDGIGERRNYAGTGVDKENNRIIIAMLNEMDGFKPNDGILVIAATNSYLSLDAALIRPGRFDLKYHIPNPDAETRKELVEIYTKGKKLAAEVNKAKLVDGFENLSAAAIETIMNEAGILAELKKAKEITMQNIIDAAAKTNSKIDIKKLK